MMKFLIPLAVLAAATTTVMASESAIDKNPFKKNEAEWRALCKDNKKTDLLLVCLSTPDDFHKRKG